MYCRSHETYVEICCKDEEMVEYGQVLIKIK
mgnify:CR=1 FL=1